MPLVVNGSDEQYNLLRREAGLAAMALGEGLTALQKADFVKFAHAQHAFFSLSIGLERLLKLTLIYEYRRINDGQFPDNNYLRDFGHNIKDLFSSTVSIANTLGCAGYHSDVVNDDICSGIIGFLSDFAVKTRYYNLDVLTGRSHNNHPEPLKGWNSIVHAQIIDKHYKADKQKIKAIHDITESIGDNFLVYQSDWDGSPIQSLEDFYLEGQKVNVCRKYSAFYTYKIVRFLSLLLNVIEGHEQFPNISEFFMIFRCDDDKYVLGRKRWNIYQP